MKHFPLPSLLLTLASAQFFGSSTATAALLFYDGFTAGGDTPATGQYKTSPDSTNGTDGNALGGQNPMAIGFNGAWSTTSGLSVDVHGRAISTGLSYSGLATSQGAVEIFRTGTQPASSQVKSYTRNFASNLGSGATELYFSGLMNFDNLRDMQISILTDTNEVFGFGFNGTGKAIVIGAFSSELAATSASYSINTTYLIVAKAYDTNKVDLWINPTDFSNESANTATKVLSGVVLSSGDFDIAGPLVTLRLSAQTGNSGVVPNYVFDEVRGSTTWGEAFNVVPEPSTGIIALLGFGLCIRRRR